MIEKKRITSFRDLEVYQNTYKAMLIVMKEIVLKLPDSEKYDWRKKYESLYKRI